MNECRKADLVLRGGNVIPMTGEADRASAVAVADGGIVYVGDDEGVRAYIGEGTRVVELAGKTLLPGFIDGHIHAPGFHLFDMKSLNFAGVESSLEAYAEALRGFVDQHPELEIYTASSMNLKVFPNSIPTKGWLDEICPDKPVALTDTSLHGRLLNSCALAMTGITRDTPNPPAGVIYHDEAGEPTGYLSDMPAIDECLPQVEYTDEDVERAFISFMAEANSYGITAIDSGCDTIPMALYHKMEVEGNLTLRVSKTVGNAEAVLDEAYTKEVLDELNEGQRYNSDFVHALQAKIGIDGVPEGKSSLLMEPYAPEAGCDPDYCGTPRYSQEATDAFVRAVNGAGYQVQAHCMGDRSIHMALDAYERSLAANGNPDVRDKIAHVNLVSDADKDRMARLGVIAAMQPMWFYYDPLFSSEERRNFGEERFWSEYHIKDMVERGIVITGSNDYPVTPDFAPLHAMQSGATQCSPYPGERDDPAYVRNAEQAVSVYEMLKMYTVNAAYASFFDELAGTVEVGKRADLVVLGADPLSVDVKTVADIEVLMTISDGRVVFEA